LQKEVKSGLGISIFLQRAWEEVSQILSSASSLWTKLPGCRGVHTLGISKCNNSSLACKIDPRDTLGWNCLRIHWR
jgi:hypothetical protein